MEEWKEYKLGELTTMKNGKKRPKNVGLYPVYGGNGVMDYADIYNAENVIIVGRVGAYCGNVFKCDNKCWVSDNAISVFPNDTINKDYLFYLMCTSDLHHHHIGAAQPLMTQDIIGNFEVKVPTFYTQQKIANILSSLDDKIEVNRRINEQLEELAQALFKSWFVDFEPFKDGEFVESELGMIPKGWKVTKLDEVSSYISRGLTPKYDNDSDEIILGQTCVRNNIVTLNNGRKHRPKKKNEKWLQQWDVLINSTGVGSLGRVGIVYFDKDNVAIDSHITVVRPISSLYKHYIGRTLLNKQAEIENMAIGSTGQTELPKDSVKSMLILLPIDDILVLFNKSIEPICKLMYSNLEEITQLSNLRDTLLPKLMSGEIDVNEVEI